MRKLIYILPFIALAFARMPMPTWTPYDAARRVPFASDPSYTRDECDWWVLNTGQPSRLFRNGVYQEQESGSWSLSMPSAWRWQPNANGVKIGLIDIAGIHAAMAIDLIQKTAPGSVVTLYPVSRYYGDVTGAAMARAALDGNQIIVFTTGYSTYEVDIFNAVALAETMNAVVVCALPNANGSVDVNADYPTSFGFANVLSVASVDRAGNHYWSYLGANVVAAPGRNIAAAGVYSSGTSYATPIAAGVLALTMAKYPGRTAEEYTQHLRDTADQLPTVKRINAVQAITTPIAAMTRL